jgi:L-ascorbate metabolism protein UlaG (beta-lactamase superfamily)
MSTIKRLSDSCLLVTSDAGTTLFDPGFHTFTSGIVDLDTIGDIQRVLVTHEHGDHVNPDFVRWLLDRGDDITVYGNDAVASLLEQSGIAVNTGLPADTSVEDVRHEIVPSGAAPPNRAWTISGVITHPGDSYAPTRSASVLALPLLTPWGSTTRSMQFARDLGPQQVVPIHDFYLSQQGRQWIYTTARNVLAASDIEVVPLDWGESCTV